MSSEYSEDTLIEAAAEEVLTDLGWTVEYAWTQETFGPHGSLGRDNKSEVILNRELDTALRKLNPNLPALAYNQAILQINQKGADKTLAALNREKYELMKNGIQVTYTDENGEQQHKRLHIFDFNQPDNNSFLAVRQLEVVGELFNRRPDMIGFVNGIPLVFFEFKAHHTDLRSAYSDNLTDYKSTIPHLFHSNAFIILSNGLDARIGTVTSPFKFFHEWKRIEEDEVGEVDMDTLLRGVCDKRRLLDLFENFILFDDSQGEITKIMAKNHQFIGVNRVIDKAKNIEDLKGKLGVFWHTQGSGKSYSMVFICQKIHRKIGGAFTFLIVADRTELETQLYETFTGVGAVTPVQGNEPKARDREHLKELLRENHRYVFTLIHKFSSSGDEEYPLITDRKNIIVLSDEAHRTQAGTFARNMRFNGIPNASYLGFTGTPLIKDEIELTKNIFGEYVSVYDFKKAIEDNATLPLRYLNRGEKLGIHNPKLDDQMAEILEREDLDEDQRKKLTRLFQKDYPILTSEKRLDTIAKDLVWHFNERGYQGKAMFVALDKPTAVRMYDLTMKYWSEYLSDLRGRIESCDDEQEALHLKRRYKKAEGTEVCVIVSSEQNEFEKFQRMGLDIEPHRRKMAQRNLEKEFKEQDNPFRLVIVCAMWITGFDVPCVSTVYLDKPIKGHTLMQTIARANRVFDDEKENGLIVDYGNVYVKLQEAYSVYGEGGRGSGSTDNENDHRPVELLIELAEELGAAIGAVEGYLIELGFDLEELIMAKSMQKLARIKDAVDAVCLNESTRTRYEIMAREVFRKFKALYPEEQARPFVRRFNAIEAIYDQLNQNVKTADITQVMLQLQHAVDESIQVERQDEFDPDSEDPFIDLSNLDFAKLKKAFEKIKRKNSLVYDLQQALERKLNQMVQQNPKRLKFYEKYREIINRYNEGKDLQATQQAFDELVKFVSELSQEEARSLSEGLDEETLAIFDLLRKDDLSREEEEQVKKVAGDTLAKLKAEKLYVERWRESTQVTAQVKTIIYDSLQWLPQEPYPDEEVKERANVVFQHVFTRYPGGEAA